MENLPYNVYTSLKRISDSFAIGLELADSRFMPNDLSRSDLRRLYPDLDPEHIFRGWKVGMVENERLTPTLRG